MYPRGEYKQFDALDNFPCTLLLLNYFFFACFLL